MPVLKSFAEALREAWDEDQRTATQAEKQTGRKKPQSTPPVAAVGDDERLRAALSAVSADPDHLAAFEELLGFIAKSPELAVDALHGANLGRKARADAERRARGTREA